MARDSSNGGLARRLERTLSRVCKKNATNVYSIADLLERSTIGLDELDQGAVSRGRRCYTSLTMADASYDEDWVILGLAITPDRFAIGLVDVSPPNLEASDEESSANPRAILDELDFDGPHAVDRLRSSFEGCLTVSGTTSELRRWVEASSRTVARPAKTRRGKPISVEPVQLQGGGIAKSGGWLRLSARSTGGGFTGLSMSVSGEAITSGMVSPSIAELDLGNAPKKAHFTCDKTGTWIARFPMVKVPSGLVAFDTDIRLQASFAGKAEIAAALGAGDAARVAEGRAATTVVEIIPAPRRPLRADPAVELSDLFVLETRSVLFALASCDAPPDTAAAVAAKLISKWVDHVGLTGRCETSFVHAQQIPAYFTKHAGPLSKSEPWRRLMRELSSVGWLSARRKQSMQSDGFEYGVAAGSQSAIGDCCISLAFWKYVEKESARALEQDRLCLRELIDELMTKASGVQGMMGCWQYSPTIGLTAYEQACGLEGGDLRLRRSWQTRFLRGVTDDWCWLGPALWKRLGQRDAARLRQVATVSSVADGVRVRAHPEVGVDHLERALAKLLPAKSDSSSGQRKRRMA